MAHVPMAAVLAAASIALGLAGTAPARAEFFGCNDRPGQVLYDSSWHHGSSRYARYTREYAAQPRRSRHARVTYSSAPRYYDRHVR